MRDFRELKVWEKSHQLALKVYRASAGFPKDERYGLTSQVRRSAASIPANIAEGCGRDSPAELLRFCRIAMGSASELEYELLLAHDLDWLDDVRYRQIAEDLVTLRKMLNTFIQKLKNQQLTANSQQLNAKS
jgi:four helix bundle protein